MLGNVFILGDSYSTFEGYIPEGYSIYYYLDGPGYTRGESTLEKTDNDVTQVSHTWWYDLVKENGTLVRNCSWSGTTICNTGYNGSDNTEVSFIGRMKKLLKEGFFQENKVDTIFLFGGTNDSWADAPIGKAMHSDWTTEDLYHVLPAFSYLINLLVSELPDTKIYCILNTELKPEIKEFYQMTCEQNGVSAISLHDIDKINGHPTIKGMRQIKEQIIEYINA